MTIDKITKGRSPRALFDFLGHEFSKTRFEDKILTLNELHKAKLLDKILKDYKKRYDNSHYQHVYIALQKTLIGYLSFLKAGHIIYNIPRLNALPLQEIVEDLKLELEKFDNEYSYEKLISAYVLNKKEEYEKLSKFYQVDFDQDIREKLKIRDEKENKPYYLSYTHLYNFLKHDLLKDFQKNEFKGYQIEMGMAPQIVDIIRENLKNPNRESYIKTIEHIIKVIY